MGRGNRRSLHYAALPKVDHRLCRPTGGTKLRGVDTSLFISHQLCLGAPRSHQRTWDKQDGAKPLQRSIFFSFPSPPKLGCPILRAVGEGWDKQNLRGRASGAEQWYPTLRQAREGWGTRPSLVTDGVFLLREPHAVRQRHGSKREIQESAVERSAVPSGSHPGSC